MTCKTHALALLAVTAALVISGCGGDGSGGYGGTGGSGTSAGDAGAYAPPKPAPNPEEGAVFVSLGNVPGLGLVLVDSGGSTLYDFHKDKGTESACYGECAEIWPPLLSEDEPHPSNGASAAKIGTTKRRDGSVQVTYAGHPLYTYGGDKSPGEANGNGLSSFGGEWYALKASGAEADG